MRAFKLIALVSLLFITQNMSARGLALYTAIVVKNKTGSTIDYELNEVLGPQSSIFFIGDTKGKIYRKPRKLFDIGTQTILSETNHNIVILNVFNRHNDNFRCRVGVVLETKDYQARVQSVVTDGLYCKASWQAEWLETDTKPNGIIGKPVQITISRNELIG